ncbi:MAG: chloride channel protein [Rhizomicrobium sp.]
MVGLAAIGLAHGSDSAQALFSDLIHRWHYAGLLVTPLGFGVVVWLTQRFFPGTQGSGIPQAIAARELKNQEDRAKLVGARSAIGKVLMTLFGLLVGASTGREGPTVQVGAAIMFLCGKISPRRQAGLILAGAAAGVAGAFNTPLAGIVFAIEEMSRSFEIKTSNLILSTVILAGFTSLILMGNYTYFGVSHDVLHFGPGWLAVPLCGLAGGLLGAVFASIMLHIPRAIPGKIGQTIGKHPVAFAVVCGLVVAFCGLVTNGATNGTGYLYAKGALSGSHTLALIYTPLKFLATIASTASGLPGGIFSPSLSVGAGLGADIAGLFPHVPLSTIVLLGMVAYFTGVTQAPITGFVIVMEMTDNSDMLLPLMATAMIAQFAAKRICKEGVYHAQAKLFLASFASEQPKPKPRATLPPAADTV